MTTRLAVLAVLGALALSPAFAGAQEEARSLEQLVVEMAHTRAEHSALARYYRDKAGEARALAQRHQSMGRAYGGGKSPQRQHFQNHCRRIAEQQEAMAQEYEALAKLHEQEAGQAE